MKNNTAKLYRIALLAGLMTATSHADTLFTISGANASVLTNLTIGANFTVGGSDLIVTSLGVQDFNDDGLLFSHQVGIWAAGAGSTLASVTVGAGTVASLNSHFRYVSLSGPTVTLLAGQTYFIGAQMNGDVYSGANQLNVSALSPAALNFDSRYNSASGTFANQNADSGGVGNLRWGPANMQFSVVPEPSTYGLIGAGALASVAFVRRRRKLAGKAA